MEYELLFDKVFVKEYRKLDKSLQMEGDKKNTKIERKSKGDWETFEVFP